MSLSTDLLDILRCPESKGELLYFAAGDGDSSQPFLFCPESRLRYTIDEQGIPVMLVEDAIRLDEAACEALVARAKSMGLPVPAREG